MRLTNHLAFVDPFSSVRFMATHLRSAGIRISAIYTGNKLDSDYLTFQAELFDHHFFLQDFNSQDDLVAALRNVDVQRVYTSFEISVAVADELANAVNPEFANPMASSLARCDKYEMQEALRKAGIPCVKQLKIQNKFEPQDLGQLLQWQFPVIVKPLNSFATVGVKVCHSIDEIKKFLQTAIKKNIYRVPITAYVVQELLIGEEYFIDTFSLQGKHYVSGVQRYKRILQDHVPICLYSEVVPLDTNEANLCIDYVMKTLSAVELNNGFSHTEVMLTDKGPYLIEVNPRVSGASGCNHKLFQYCNYPTQVDFLIDSCKNQTTIWPKEKRYGRKVYLHNFVERSISALNIALLKSLPSYKESLMIKSPGSIVGVPQNLTDVVAFVLLSHSDAKQIEKDTVQIQQWEKELVLF